MRRESWDSTSLGQLHLDLVFAHDPLFKKKRNLFLYPESHIGAHQLSFLVHLEELHINGWVLECLECNSYFHKVEQTKAINDVPNSIKGSLQ